MSKLKITDDIIYVGGNNCKERVFEGEIPLKKGMSYNSYLILDEKTCLLDTVEEALKTKFLASLKRNLKQRELDYLIVHHLEPDHTSGIVDIIKTYPDVELYISPMGMTLLKQFFPEVVIAHYHFIKEGDELHLGKHNLKFYNAPMVHWPEVVVSYDTYSKTLFSADAFGSFTVYKELDCSLYEDQDELLYETRRYYANIVSKYGQQVNALLDKLKDLEIERICSLHGPIHTCSIPSLLQKYKLWSNYEKEDNKVMIAVCSIYGHSLIAGYILKDMFEKDHRKAVLIDLNKVDFSVSLTHAMMHQDIVLIAPTFNMGLFPKMREFLEVVVDHQLKNKRFAIIENGSWCPQAKDIMTSYIKKLKACDILPTSLTINSALGRQDLETLRQIVKEVDESMVKKEKEQKKVIHKWKCKICGFVYEGESLPADFHCPICGHPASDFVQID